MSLDTGYALRLDANLIGTLSYPNPNPQPNPEAAALLFSWVGGRCAERAAERGGAADADGSLQGPPALAARLGNPDTLHGMCTHAGLGLGFGSALGPGLGDVTCEVAWRSHVGRVRVRG